MGCEPGRLSSRFAHHLAQYCIRLHTQIVLGSETATGDWKGELITQNHNAANSLEANRLREEHPGEPACVMHDRVLGDITVTRGK